jgi:hypothetical protein
VPALWRLTVHGRVKLGDPPNRRFEFHKRSQLFVRTHVFARPLRNQTHRELVYRPLQFHERSHLLIGTGDETLSFAMRVSNPAFARSRSWHFEASSKHSPALDSVQPPFCSSATRVLSCSPILPIALRPKELSLLECVFKLLEHVIGRIEQPGLEHVQAASPVIGELSLFALRRHAAQ